MMNVLLESSGLPQNMWGEALFSANYLLNKISRKKKDKTPYELWKGRKPSYHHLKMWGCLAKVMAPLPKRMKIGPKTVDCIFIGYAEHSNAYRFLVHDSKNLEIHKNTIMESKNTSFFENIFPCKTKEVDLKSTKRVLETISEDSSNDQGVELEIEPRRSKRARIEKSFGSDFLTFMLEDEPQTYNDAIRSPEGTLWKDAIKSEIESIMQNHTWELMDLPPGIKRLSSKWIFKRKMKADGSIDKYKARLVIKGYRQKEGLDYFDTYSHVSRITSIRMILAIATLRNLEVHQMDVKIAFLNGELDEEIYMEQPEGHVVPGQERKVCKLVKSLYGLKEAPKQWHEKFDNVMMTNGFKINECDKCVYVKTTDIGYVILCLYVEDILIFGSNNEMDDFVIAKTPIDISQHLSKNKGQSVDQVEYARVIGSLMYLMSCTRPDIAFTISSLRRFTSNPNANWISDIQDTKGTSGYVFTLGGGAVSWKSSRQTIITRSTMESEFVALDKTREEAEWLRQFLEDIPEWPKPVPTVCIYCDNQATIARAQNCMYNG
ncbi:hypothetical protein V6N13_041128 [Hibiscus sabdariffa]